MDDGIAIKVNRKLLILPPRDRWLAFGWNIFQWFPKQTFYPLFTHPFGGHINVCLVFSLLADSSAIAKCEGRVKPNSRVRDSRKSICCMMSVRYSVEPDQHYCK